MAEHVEPVNLVTGAITATGAIISSVDISLIKAVVIGLLVSLLSHSILNLSKFLFSKLYEKIGCRYRRFRRKKDS